MKKPVVIISIICVLIIAGGILVLTGVIDLKGLFGGKSKEAESAEVKEAEVWISYMDSCVLLDKYGTVIGTTMEAPEDVMQLTGVYITRMIKGDPVEVDDKEAFDYGLLVTNKLAAVGIPDKGEVFISEDHSAIVYLKNIKILLGKEDDLLEKLEALRKFYKYVIEYDGTLDMQELDRNKMGYTFKVNGAESETRLGTEEETTDTGEETTVEEEYFEDEEGTEGV